MQFHAKEDYLLFTDVNSRSIWIYEKGKKKVIYTSSIENLEVEPKKHLVWLGIPGKILMDEEERIYVESYHSDKEKYRIYSFSPEGELLYVFGEYPTLLWFDVDEEENLWVLYQKEEGNKTLEKYTPYKELLFSFHSSSCIKYLQIPCNTFYPLPSGEEILLIGKKEGSYLIGYYSLKEESFFWVFPQWEEEEEIPFFSWEEGILFWEFLGEEGMRLLLYTLKGDLIKSIRMEPRGNFYKWRGFFPFLDQYLYAIYQEKDDYYFYRFSYAR